MHAFILGRDVGFSAERFYGGVADLLAGVEEEEGYVIDGKWVGWEGREERKKRAMEALTRAEEVTSDKAGGADIIKRTASDQERWRMEEILRSMSSRPPSRSSPSSPYPEEREEVRLEVRTRRPAPVESEGLRDRNRWEDTPKPVDPACIASVTAPEYVLVRREADPQESDNSNLSTIPPTRSQAGSQETSLSPSRLPRL